MKPRRIPFMLAHPISTTRLLKLSYNNLREMHKLPVLTALRAAWPHMNNM